MKFMGATWRRSGMSRAAMRSYYNEKHGPLVAEDKGEIYRYTQNVVEDSVFYCKDSHAPLNQPDGLTEFDTLDQDALARSFATEHMKAKAWPDTGVYADLSQVLSVAGDERAVVSSDLGEKGLTKVMSFVIVPAEKARFVPTLADDLAQTLSEQDLAGLGVRECRLVTALEHPNEFLRKTFDQPGLRAVAGTTMYLEAGHSWEMPGVAEAISKKAGEAFDAEVYVFTTVVKPKVVWDVPPAA